MAVNPSNGSSYGCDFGLSRSANDPATVGTLDKIDFELTWS